MGEWYECGTSFRLLQMLHFHVRPALENVTKGLMYVRQRLHRTTPVGPKSTSGSSRGRPRPCASGCTHRPKGRHDDDASAGTAGIAPIVSDMYAGSQFRLVSTVAVAAVGTPV